MKKISILGASLLAALMSVTSCSDDFSAGDNAWDKEQYAHYISFKAPLGDNGVTELYVPYTRKNIDRTPMYPEEGRNGKGISEYYLPVIVSGSTTNKQNITVHVGADPDTLASVNESRFQLRTDLYYKDMSQYASYPETVNVPSGQDVSLMHIKFDFTDIDLVNKWVLPIQILDDPSYGYTSHPRKNYAKAMLRILPFNDWSGDYSGTGLKIFIAGDNANASAVDKVRLYVVDENTVFFYPGTIDEDRLDRANYKIYAEFVGDEASGVVNFRCDNPNVKFTTGKQASYRVVEEMDAVQDYIKHRYVIINNVDYSFVDYTSVKGYELAYAASGSLTLERKINTQIEDGDYAIQW